jgi:hypothetical protein
MNFQRVAVNHTGLTDKIVGQSPARQQQEHRHKGSAFAHDVGYRRLAQITGIGFRPVLKRLQCRQVLGPLGIVKLGAAQP